MITNILQIFKEKTAWLWSPIVVRIWIVLRYLFKGINRFLADPLLVFAVIFVFGFWVHYSLYRFNLWQSIYYTISLFMGDIRFDPEKMDIVKDTFLGSILGNIISVNHIIYLAAIFASSYTVLLLVRLVSKKMIEGLTVNIHERSKAYILVIGLGKKGTHFIDSLLADSEQYDIVVIEKDPSNVNIEKYRNRNVGVVIGDGSDAKLLKENRVVFAKKIVLMAGKDVQNLEIALVIHDILKNVSVAEGFIQKLYMHIEDQSLYHFYRDKGLLSNMERLPIKIFSMAQNSAKYLFLYHDVDGGSRAYIDSDKSFSIAVVSNSPLALEVIRQAAETAHFPNGNKMRIYCIDTDADVFKKDVMMRYPHIERIDNIELLFKSLDSKSERFYDDGLWKEMPVNVILCAKNPQANLDIASELLDKTYLKASHLGVMKTKIHIAVHENEKIAEHIKQNKSHYSSCFTFALTKEMASADYVFDEGFEKVAKAIHAGYDKQYEPFIQKDEVYIEKKWLDNTKLSDRESNYAQAYHIPIKLKALGMKIAYGRQKESVETVRQKFFKLAVRLQEERSRLGLTDKELMETTSGKGSFAYFPKSYDTLFEKMIKSEHDRWIAHHFLKGWRFAEVTNKPLKMHNCLIPFEMFPPPIKHTVLYDIYSILYIPNYLAQAGLTVEAWGKERVVLGVTGHRVLGTTKKTKILEMIVDALEKLSVAYEYATIVSPLAEGADIMVAEKVIETYKSSLVIPLPMSIEAYKQTFVDNDSEKFDALVKKYKDYYYLVEADEAADAQKYLAVGKEVVDVSDILIAVWDGKRANGVGGTADIVAYAKKMGKKVLHINSETLKVDYINLNEEL